MYAPLQDIPVAPTFHPTAEEFTDPLAFIEKIKPEAERWELMTPWLCLLGTSHVLLYNNAERCAVVADRQCVVTIRTACKLVQHQDATILLQSDSDAFYLLCIPHLHGYRQPAEALCPSSNP